jgi:Chaperone of endosialidase
MKNRNITFTAVLLACFALLSGAKAVSPAPDGGYPNFTTGEGQNALLHLTTGAANTAVGWFSLDSVTTGSFNTAVGAGTLLSNTGEENTAVGTAALLLNTASGNTAVGSKALLNNTTGGTLGTTFGEDVGPNTAVGSEALRSNIITSANTAVGYQALGSYATGFMGTDLGTNTAVGFQALGNATGGDGNCGFGYRSLYNNTGGRANTALGQGALLNNTTGGFNTAVGVGALASNTTGSSNTVIGFAALANSTGSNNTALGYQAGNGVTTASNVICIGSGGQNIDNSCFMGNIAGVPLVGGAPVVVAQNGQLGTAASSRRFKTAIEPMDKASEALFSLNPVAFRYKKEIDPKGTRQLGLVAEEVEKVNLDLVVRDKEGKPYSVRYDQVNAMLLNEFLKEHKKVQQLEATVAQQRDDFEIAIAELKKEMNSVVARFEDSKTEKMGAQMQITRRGRQIVLSNP